MRDGVTGGIQSVEMRGIFTEFASGDKLEHATRLKNSACESPSYFYATQTPLSSIKPCDTLCST